MKWREREREREKVIKEKEMGKKREKIMET